MFVVIRYSNSKKPIQEITMRWNMNTHMMPIYLSKKKKKIACS